MADHAGVLEQPCRCSIRPPAPGHPRSSLYHGIQHHEPRVQDSVWCHCEWVSGEDANTFGEEACISAAAWAAAAWATAAWAIQVPEGSTTTPDEAEAERRSLMNAALKAAVGTCIKTDLYAIIKYLEKSKTPGVTTSTRKDVLLSLALDLLTALVGPPAAVAAAAAEGSQSDSDEDDADGALPNSVWPFACAQGTVLRITHFRGCSPVAKRSP